MKLILTVFFLFFIGCKVNASDGFLCVGRRGEAIIVNKAEHSSCKEAGYKSVIVTQEDGYIKITAEKQGESKE